jgi:hypothetical protein
VRHVLAIPTSLVENAGMRDVHCKYTLHLGFRCRVFRL